MSGLVLAAALAAAPTRAATPAEPAGVKPYGILLLADDVDVSWRKELGSLRAQIKGHAVESAIGAGNLSSLQRAVDRLAAQHIGRIVAVPLETVSQAAWIKRTSYFFGVRHEPYVDRPDSDSGDIADRPLTALHPQRASPLRSAPKEKRLESSLPLLLGPTMDQSPILIDILADRAKTLAKNQSQEGLVVIGIAPRSDQDRKIWLESAQAAAVKIGAKAGFREALAVGVRDGIRPDQQYKDRASLRAAMRELARKGRICVVPLSPQTERVHRLFDQTLGGFLAYRWDGRGIQGDRRLGDWIKASAEQTSAAENLKSGAPKAPGGIR